VLPDVDEVESGSSRLQEYEITYYDKERLSFWCFVVA